MQRRRKGLTPLKMTAVYAAAALLVLLHESDRLSTWLEDLGRKGESWPFARILDAAADLKGLAASSGLVSFKAGESRLIESLTPRGVLGSVAGARRRAAPSAPPPSPAPYPPAAPGSPGSHGAAGSPGAAAGAVLPPSGAAAGLTAADAGPASRPGDGPGHAAQGAASLLAPPGPPAATRGPLAQALPGAAQNPSSLAPPGLSGAATYSPPAPGSPEARSPVVPAPAGGPVYGRGPVPGDAERRPDYRNILIVGDSFMVEGFGPVLERELRKIPELAVKRVFKSATGLCRPDFFDWFAFMDGLLEENQPELVVLSLGANDTQDIVTDDRKRHMVATEGWNKVYGERVKGILDMAGDAGATVFWVGLPVMGKKLYNERVSNINGVVAGVCAESLNCRFFDTREILADPEGAFTAFTTAPDGKHERIRAKDSIHLTELGGEILVSAFLKSAGGWGIFGVPGGDAAPDGAGALALAGPGLGGPGGAGSPQGAVISPAQGGLAPPGAEAAATPGAAGAAPPGGQPPSSSASASASPAHPPSAGSLAPGDAPAEGPASALSALRAPSPRPAGSYPAEALAPAALLEVNLPSRARMRETSYLLCIPGPEDVARPTVILLHGPDEGYQVWRDRFGRFLVDLARDLDVNLLMPDGDPFGWYLDSPFKRDSRVESYIMRELIPDAAGRFLMDPDRVGLLGVSMGGHGALTLAMKYPGRFRSVASLSGITVLESHIGDPAGGPPLQVESVLGPYRSQGALWRGSSAYHMARRDPASASRIYMDLSVGVADPVALAENRQFHRLLNDLSVPHGYSEKPRGGHGWDLWTGEVPARLAEVARRL